MGISETGFTRRNFLAGAAAEREALFAAGLSNDAYKYALYRNAFLADGKEVEISAVYGSPATAPDEFEVVMSDTLAFRLDPEKGGSPVRLVAVVPSAWIGKSGIQPGESGVFRGRLY